MMKSIFLIYIVLYSSYILPNVTSEIQTTFDKYYPTSCQDPSIIEDGEYQIYPDGLVPVTVYCEVTKGGWTTIFNKVTKCDFFNQSWTDYLYGFGSPVSNYWAGLVNMRNLVLTEPMTLRIELSNSAEDEFFIEYESFYIGPEENGFVLHVGNRTRGNLVDSFSPMSRAKFYTFDKFKPPVVNINSSNIPRFGPINNNKLALMHRVTVNETVIDTPYEIKASYFRGAWWYTLEGDSSVCLTCNPKTPFEGNWQQHTNLLSFSQAKMMLRPRNEFRPSNCYDIYKQGGIKQDGIYNIYLSDSSKPTRVYCEMQKGGWTRIFNRIDRLTPTYDRLWSEYKDGFGEIEENHWLGLRSIQALTYQELMTLRIEVASDTKRDSEFIEHPAFLVYSENQMFKMVVNASNRGTLQDWMFNNHNGMIFYTKDVDSITNCATDNLGGWWFNPSNCYRVCLTCAKLTLGQYSAIGSDPTYPTSRKNFMKMLIRPTHI